MTVVKKLMTWPASFFQVKKEKPKTTATDKVVVVELKLFPPVPTLENVIDRKGDEEALADLAAQELVFAEYGERDGEQGLPDSKDTIYSPGMKSITRSFSQAYKGFDIKVKSYCRGIQLRLEEALHKKTMSDEAKRKEIEGIVDAEVKRRVNEVERRKTASPLAKLQTERDALMEKLKAVARKIRNMMKHYNNNPPKGKFYDKVIEYWSALTGLCLLDVPVNQVVISVMLPTSPDPVTFVFAFAITLLIMVLAHISGAQIDISKGMKIDIKNETKFWPPFIVGMSITTLLFFLRFLAPEVVGFAGILSGLFGIAFFLLSMYLAASRQENFEYFQALRDEKLLQKQIAKKDERLKKVEQPFLEEIGTLEDSKTVLIESLLLDRDQAIESEEKSCKELIGKIEDYQASQVLKMEEIFDQSMEVYMEENLLARRKANKDTNVPDLFNTPISLSDFFNLEPYSSDTDNGIAANANNSTDSNSNADEDDADDDESGDQDPDIASQQN